LDVHVVHIHVEDVFFFNHWSPVLYQIDHVKQGNNKKQLQEKEIIGAFCCKMQLGLYIVYIYRHMT